MNNDQEIILAKISAVYDKPPFVKMETGQMEMILKCVGLGAYYDKYREYLEPYWYNGRFQNPVESYRIFVGLNSIFEDLLNERKGDEIISLLTELGNYIPGTILSDEARFAADFNKLRQLYNLMGLQIVSMEVDEYSSKFQVEPYLNEGNQIIQSFGMERWLKSKYQDVYEAYAICPKDAITMIEDEEGFEYPQIDENKCVHCYQCIKVCPFKATKEA